MVGQRIGRRVRAFFASMPRQVCRPGNTRLGLAASLLVMAAVCLRPVMAAAQIGSDRYSSIVIDAASGRMLESVNPDDSRYPASLTKMMTIYMLFEALRDRRVTLDQLVPVSAHAASMSPTKLGLVPGTRITVEEALLGLVTKSANDAAAALGELLGGTEERFAEMMTLRARALGMKATTFRNASGLPDPAQVTTARDMAVLARHLLQDFPDRYHYFSTPEFVFHGKTIPNHDHLLTTYPGADGIKTGYTRASGYNLVTSAQRSGVRLIGVVMGASTYPRRDLHMEALLDRAFLAMDVPAQPRAMLVDSIPRLVGTAQAASVSFATHRSAARKPAAEHRRTHAKRVATTHKAHHSRGHTHHKAARSRAHRKRVAATRTAHHARGHAHRKAARKRAHPKRVAVTPHRAASHRTARKKHATVRHAAARRHHAKHRRAAAGHDCSGHAAHSKRCERSDRLANR